MARIGILKTYPAGSLTAAAIPGIFALIKSVFTDAGFTVFNVTATSFEVLRHGVAAGTVSDDEPHWAFALIQGDGKARLLIQSVHGVNRDHAQAHTGDQAPLTSDNFFVGAPEVALRFVADGEQGWWWLHLRPNTTDPDQAWAYGLTSAGVTSRRYPTDRYQGIYPRYGIWGHQGNWSPPYARLPDGSIKLQPGFATWSPLGLGQSNPGRRWPGIPLPRMAVPQFPVADGVAAGILGEFNEVLILTDGYAFGEEVVPGWMALTAPLPHYADHALPAPVEFLSR